MAIVFDAASTGTAGIASSLTFAHTTGSGNKRFLVVGVAYQDTTSVSSITYNGTSLTFVNRASQSSTTSELWYLANPSSGANNVVITMSGTTAYPTGSAITFTGVAQTSLVDSSNTATGNDTAPTVTTTTTRDNSWVVDCVAVQTNTGDITLTVGAGQTQRTNHSNSSQERQGTSTETTTTAGAVTMSWSLSATRRWSITTFGFKEGGVDNTLAIGQGAFALTGYNLLFVYGRKIVMAYGGYALTGFSLLFNLLRKFQNQTKNTSTLSNGTKSSSSWSNESKSNSTLNNQIKN